MFFCQRKVPDGGRDWWVKNNRGELIYGVWRMWQYRIVKFLYKFVLMEVITSNSH